MDKTKKEALRKIVELIKKTTKKSEVKVDLDENFSIIYNFDLDFYSKFSLVDGSIEYQLKIKNKKWQKWFPIKGDIEWEEKNGYKKVDDYIKNLNNEYIKLTKLFSREELEVIQDNSYDSFNNIYDYLTERGRGFTLIAETGGYYTVSFDKKNNKIKVGCSVFNIDDVKKVIEGYEKS